MSGRIFLLAAVVAGCLVTAAMASPAGVIAYACIDDDPYVLMAYDPQPGRQGFATFGGHRKGNETIAETAAREFREETRCTFDTPTAEELSRMTSSETDGYHAFVVEVPYISQLEISEHPCDAPRERSDWQWVRLSDLEKGLASGEAEPKVEVSLMHRYITLWDKAVASLRQARADGLLDSAAFCHKETAGQ